MRGSTVTLALIAACVAGLVVGPGVADTEQEAKKQPEASVPLVIPESESNRRNPRPANEESIDSGRNFYASCTMCHGETGDGTGWLAEKQGFSMPDFTDPEQLARRTDGDLFYILTKGHGDMPGKERFDEQWRWDLVNYLRTLADGD